MAISRADISRFRALRQKKERAATGLFVAEGVKVVTELVASPLQVETVLATSEAFLSSLDGDFEKELITQRQLEQMSNLSTPNVALAVARIPKAPQPDWKQSVILALDGLRDPGNMGTIIRTAKWFGVKQVLCSPDCVDAFSPKVVQSAMGALFHTGVIYSDLEALLKQARISGCSVVCSALEGISLYELDVPNNAVFVIGSESHGASDAVRKVCDLEVSIPNFEESQQVESLNAAIAASIFLSESARPRKA